MGVGANVGVGTGVAVGAGAAVGIRVGVRVGVGVGGGAFVGAAVPVGIGVVTAVGVAAAAGVGTTVGVGVGSTVGVGTVAMDGPAVVVAGGGRVGGGVVVGIGEIAGTAVGMETVWEAVVGGTTAGCVVDVAMPAGAWGLGSSDSCAQPIASIGMSNSSRGHNQNIFAGLVYKFIKPILMKSISHAVQHFADPFPVHGRNRCCTIRRWLLGELRPAKCG